jgi:cytoskeletal protein CcmA (bactofilin family)
MLFRSNAYYIGDIETNSIAIEAGAVISGKITTRVDGDPEEPFSDMA